MQTNPFARVLHGLARRGFAIAATIPPPEFNPDHRLAVISQDNQRRLIVVVPMGHNGEKDRNIANWEKVEYYILQKQQRASRTDFIFVSEADECRINWDALESQCTF